MSKLIIKDLKYSYDNGDHIQHVLTDINASFESGKLYCIIGESGSGKTTLISLLSALDELQDGDIIYDDVSLKKIGNDKFRRHYVNIVFQAYNLLTYLTARENVEIGIDLAGEKINSKEEAYRLLKTVGIDQKKADRLVLKLSGGEQQRVAIARACAGNVPIIVADEPTGNLDEDTEIKILEIFKELANKGKIVIIVSHSKEVAKFADEVYRIKKGAISKEK